MGWENRAESFLGKDHLNKIIEEAQVILDRVFSQKLFDLPFAEFLFLFKRDGIVNKQISEIRIYNNLNELDINPKFSQLVSQNFLL